MAEVTEEGIKVNVYKIYYQLVVGRKQVSSIDANIENYEKLLHDTKEIYKNGFAEKLDVDKVQVQLSNLYTQKLKAQNQIDAGIAGLKFLMNMPQKDSLILTDTLSDEELKSNILDQNYNYEDRKEFQLLGLQSKLQEFNVRRYKLSKVPTLSFEASINRRVLHAVQARARKSRDRDARRQARGDRDRVGVREVRQAHGRSSGAATARSWRARVIPSAATRWRS